MCFFVKKILILGSKFFVVVNLLVLKWKISFEMESFTGFEITSRKLLKINGVIGP